MDPKLFEELEAARLAHEEAQAAHQAARQAETDALGRYEKAAEVVQAAIDELRLKAPRQSKWYNP